MKTSRGFSVALALAMSLMGLAAAFAFAPAARAQGQPYGALERGYRTGYSDGYQSGWTDQLKGAGADYRSKAEYGSADRAYIAAYGQLEEYRDGYQQGFEVGYEAGYNRRGFDSELPASGITRRGAAPREASASNEGVHGGRPADADESASQSRGSDRTQSDNGPAQSGVVGTASTVASNTVLTVELMNRLSTDVSQPNDRFEAQVVEPKEYAGAIVGGRLANVERAGKSRGRALLQLDFDRIRMPGASDWEQFSAQVIEVVQTEESGAGEVDPEGGVRGKSTTKDDVTKVGASAGIGAIIGAIAGGGKGAVIGAVIGGGASTAGVMQQRGKDIHLERGQQLRIRTTSRNR
ncbi:MAG: hypothetical protein QOE46_2861 [Acidobacteriota bacterium]|jgi:hypothetical protein|nr:hypothetical protein [Acidobacteriota bacterium]